MRWILGSVGSSSSSGMGGSITVGSVEISLPCADNIAARLSATCSSFMLTRRERENIGGQVCQPERDVTFGQLPVKRMRDGGGKFAERDGLVSGDVVAMTDGLRAFSAQQESGGHVVDIDGMDQRPATVDQAG